MCLTKEDCENMLEDVLNKCVCLLNEQYDLTNEFNLNDFGPNEKRIEEIKKLLIELNKIVEGLQGYMNLL